MSLPAAPLGAGPDEFLAWEREQTERHVYFRGEVFAMSGGTPRHSALSATILSLLRLPKGPCHVHTSDLRLGVANDHFVYADAVMVCGPVELRPGTTDVLTNPSVIVEVLSKSTEAYDRGEKQAAYLALPSLRHFLLVSQRELRVEVYTREADARFRYDIHRAGARVLLTEPTVSFAVDELYDGMFALPGD